MALTLQEIQGLRAQGEYRQTIAALDEWEKEGFPGTTGIPADRGPFFLEKAWAHYQLGEYAQAEEQGTIITRFLAVETDAGESARRLVAHCAERRGDLDRAENILQDVPSNPARDNLYLTILIGKSRKGLPVSPVTVMELVAAAQMRTPYQVVDGHIVNNAAWLLHGARQQEAVKPFLPILPGLIEVAIGIYEATGAANNHRAAALFRASHIFEAADWAEGAVVVITESITLWGELVASQGGERYRQNLQGAKTQEARLQKMRPSPFQTST